MLGHSNVVITEHYLASLNPDVTFGINDPNFEGLASRKNPPGNPPGILFFS
jgi:hypothetical protein